MKKSTLDPKVKKSFVRNCEQKIPPSNRNPVVREVDFSPHAHESGTSVKGSELSEPALCSSVAFVNYLSSAKNSTAPPLSAEDVDQGDLPLKMTKKLNFHVNDRIYKNLVEFNLSMEENKSNSRKPSRHVISAKKDMEPNIEDFCEDEKEPDSPPKIPVIKPTFRPIKTIDTGNLHELVASFDIL